MQIIRGLFTRAGLVLMVAAAVAGSAAASARRPQSNLPPGTAVGVMANLRGGVYTLQGSQLYQFDSYRAAALFDNTFNGLVECFDNSGLPCDIAGAPTAPAPDLSQSIQSAESQVCTFLSGGSLQATSYFQTITVATDSAAYSYQTYRYRYDVVPNIGTVASLTAWNVVPSSSKNGSVGVTVTGEVANEVVTMLAPTVPSYAFQTGSLLYHLYLYVNGKEVKLSTDLVQNCAECLAGQPGSLDIVFTPNVGTLGTASSYIKSGDARTILNSDADPSNDNGGPTGNLLQETLFHSWPLQLAPGNYTLQLNGNSGGITFSVGGRVRVLGASCSVN